MDPVAAHHLVALACDLLAGFVTGIYAEFRFVPSDGASLDGVVVNDVFPLQKPLPEGSEQQICLVRWRQECGLGSRLGLLGSLGSLGRLGSPIHGSAK
jgi:hypothetical protein